MWLFIVEQGKDEEVLFFQMISAKSQVQFTDLVAKIIRDIEGLFSGRFCSEFNRSPITKNKKNKTKQKNTVHSKKGLFELLI